MAIDFKNMCRTCLETEKPCMIPLYDKDPNKPSSVFEMLQNLTTCKFTLSNGFPEKICTSCFTEINRAYSFKIKCEASDQTLKQLLGTDDEKEDDYDDDANNDNYEELEINFDKTEYFDSVETENKEVEEECNEENESKDKIVFEILEIQNSATKTISVELKNNEKPTQTIKAEKKEQDEIDVTTVKPGRKRKQFSVNDQNKVKQKSNINDKERKRQILKCPHCPADFVFQKNFDKHLNWHKKSLETQTQIQQKSLKENEKSKSFENEISDNENFISNNELAINSSIEEIIVESIVKPEIKDSPLNSPYTCEKCGAGFHSVRSLNWHNKVNRCEENLFECLICHKIFINREAFVEHIKIHTEVFQCSICMKEFSSEEEYKLHTDTEHAEGKQVKNQCPICKKSFTMLSALKDHERIHSGEKPFICETCGKGFSQSTNLKQHAMRHSNIKPFKCELCTYEFVSKGELNSHMRTHTGEHPFVCDTCAAGFTTSSSLKKHTRIHTGERPYACEFCPMRFVALGTLKNHRRTHTGEKPYECRYCQKAFAQQSDRVTHERCHTGERPYVCTICGSAFQQNGALRIHMKLHGKESKNENKKDKLKKEELEIEPLSSK